MEAHENSMEEKLALSITQVEEPSTDFSLNFKQLDQSTSALHICFRPGR